MQCLHVIEHSMNISLSLSVHFLCVFDCMQYMCVALCMIAFVLVHLWLIRMLMVLQNFKKAFIQACASDNRCFMLV